MFNKIEESVSYIRALAILAASDRSISRVELKLISHFSKKYGIDPSMIVNELVGLVASNEDEISNILEPIKTKRQKLLLINDLITISKIDCDYSHEEKVRISKISKILGLSEQELLSIEDLNDKMTELMKNFKQLLELDDEDLSIIEFSFPE